MLPSIENLTRVYIKYETEEDELETHETNPVNMHGQVLLHSVTIWFINHLLHKADDRLHINAYVETVAGKGGRVDRCAIWFC